MNESLGAYISMWLVRMEHSQQRCGLKYDEYHEYVASANEHSQQRCGLKYDEYHEYVASANDAVA